MSEMDASLSTEPQSVWGVTTTKRRTLSLREIQRQQLRERRHLLQTRTKPTYNSHFSPFERTPRNQSTTTVLLSDFISLPTLATSSVIVTPKTPPKTWNIRSESDAPPKVASLREIQEQERAQKCLTSSGIGHKMSPVHMGATSSPPWTIPSSPNRTSFVDIQHEEREKQKQQKKFFRALQTEERAVRQIEEFYRSRDQYEFVTEVRRIPQNLELKHNSDNNKPAR
jgi:hypothetical protein